MNKYFYGVVFQKNNLKKLDCLYSTAFLLKTVSMLAVVWYIVEMFFKSDRIYFASEIFVLLSLSALIVEIFLNKQINVKNREFEKSEEEELALFHKDFSTMLSRTNAIAKARNAILFSVLGILSVLLILTAADVFMTYVVYYIKILICAFTAVYVFGLFVFLTRISDIQEKFAKKNAKRIVKLSCLKDYTKNNESFPVLRPNRFLSFVGTLFFGRFYAKKVLKLKVYDDAKDLKPPYVLLVNHQSGFDFIALHQAMYPRLLNAVIAYNQMLGHKKLWLQMGMLPKRQFDSSIHFLRQSKRVIENGGILTIYPEGKISSDGTRGELSSAIAKLLKLIKLPVVMCKLKGCYLFKPKWAFKKRTSGRTEAHIEPLLNTDELARLSVEDIYEKILRAFEHDEFKWQRQNKVEIRETYRAEGLERILYKCPNCLEEFQTSSDGDRILCGHCGKVWRMDSFGVLSAECGSTEFDSVADWYDFQKKSARKAMEEGYFNSERCEVSVLPDLKGWKKLGEGILMFDGEKLKYIDDDGEQIEFDARQLYTVPFGFDDGFMLTKDNVTYSFMFANMQQATKLSLLVEENFKLRKAKNENNRR